MQASLHCDKKEEHLNKIQSRIFVVLVEGRVWFPEATSGSSQTPVTQDLVYPVPPSDLWGHLYLCGYKWRHTHTEKTHTKNNLKIFMSNNTRQIPYTALYKHNILLLLQTLSWMHILVNL